MSNLADIDIDSLGKSSPPPEPGWYHLKLCGYQAKTFPKGTIGHQLTFQIIGTTQELSSERGKYIYENFFQHTQVFWKLTAILGVALGIYSKDYLKALQDKGEDLPMPEFDSWVGATCIGRVKHEPDKNDPNKVYGKVGFDFQSVDSETVQVAGIVLCATSAKEGEQVQATAEADVF